MQASGKLPFNQLPILEHNGVVLAQSNSIARYLAKLYGLYGNTPIEGALADMIVDGVLDLSSARNAAKTDDEKAKFEKESLPKWLTYFENLLKKNDSNGFFVGHTVRSCKVTLIRFRSLMLILCSSMPLTIPTDCSLMPSRLSLSSRLTTLKLDPDQTLPNG